MSNNDPMSLPLPAFMGGTKAITMTPVVGTPRREYGEMFIPGEEELEDGEMRVTVLGSGNPWVTRGQSSASILVEVGNAKHTIFVFDLGSGSLANYASLKLPVNKLNDGSVDSWYAGHWWD
jgi:ribonuclease Z